MDAQLKKVFRSNLKILSEHELHTDLNDLFNNERFNNVDLGTINLSLDELVIGDPFYNNQKRKESIISEKINKGSYKVDVASILHRQFGLFYMAARIIFSDENTVQYKKANNLGDDTISGYGVETGYSCFGDRASYDAFNSYISQWKEKNPKKDLFEDLFKNLLEDNYKNFPKLQNQEGDWLNFSIPETDYNIVIFKAGFGDGYYESYWGYNKDDQITSLVTLFIDPFSFGDMGGRKLNKKFYPVENGMKTIIQTPLACIASDRITVDGKKVGCMFREKPMENVPDSGWRYTAGDETQAYMYNSDNHGIYNINVIANYDKDILPFISAPVGSCFVRGADGKFRQVEKKVL